MGLINQLITRESQIAPLLATIIHPYCLLFWEFIVDLPIKDCDFPVRYVSLPEANRYFELEQLEIAKESKLVYFHG